MRYFPLFLDVRDRKALVVGGGEEALRKVRLLLKTEARIEIVAPELHPELTDLAVGGNIAWIGRRFVSSQLDGANLVFVAADATHQRAGGGRGEEARHSRQRRRRCRPLLGHRAGDRRPRSRSSSPSAPKGPLRCSPRASATTSRHRCPLFWERSLGRRAPCVSASPNACPPAGPAASSGSGTSSARCAMLSPAASRPSDPKLETALRDAAAPVAGRVSLVGAGPGDPELLTLKAQRKLQRSRRHRLRPAGRSAAFSNMRAAMQSASRSARRPASPPPSRRRSTPSSSARPRPAVMSCASRAAIPMCSAAAARSRRRSKPKASPSTWCPASPRRSAALRPIGLPLTQRGQNAVLHAADRRLRRRACRA